jgi:hypothetical protein
MSNTINAGLLTSGGANAVSAPPTASIVLPANCLCFLDVLNRHSTSASLAAAPTLTGTGGETWHLLPGGSITTGAASPNIRVSRYYTMVSSDVTTVVTMTFSVAQTGILWNVRWISGCKTGGVDGANAIGQIVTGASSSNVTSLPLSITAFANPRNALFAAYVVTNALGVTPQTGWTESSDQNTTSCDLQGQFTLGYDTQANVTASSGLIAGIVTEVVAASATIDVRTVTNIQAATIVAGSGISTTFSVIAGRQYFLDINSTANSIAEALSLSVQGNVLSLTIDATATVVNVFAGRHRFGRFSIPTFTGPVTLRLDNPSGSGNVSCQLAIVEVSDFDKTVGGGTGIYQVVASGSSGASSGPVSMSLAALTSRNNPILVLGSDIGVFATPGYQTISDAISTSGVIGPYVRWRGNGDPTPDFGAAAAGNSVAAVAYEMAAMPGFNAPVVTLVSPANGSTIASTDAITVDATDLDGDLTAIAVAANGETVTVTGASLVSPYTTGSISVVTNGKEVVVRRTGGFFSGPLGISGTATDSQGHTTPFSFSFTVPAAIVVVPGPPAQAAVVAPQVPPQRTRDILIDVATNNIALTPTGDLSLVGGVPSIAQAVRQAMRTFLGEWFLDDEVGVPWFDQILVKAPSLPAARAVLREVVLAVPGVLAVTSMDLDLDKITRTLSVTFAATSDVGELVETIEIAGREVT